MKACMATVSEFELEQKTSEYFEYVKDFFESNNRTFYNRVDHSGAINIHTDKTPSTESQFNTLSLSYTKGNK